jgi:hypothetical protein
LTTTGGRFVSVDRQSVAILLRPIANRWFHSRVDRELARLRVEIATGESAPRLRCAGFTSIPAAFVPIFEPWIWP